jgi:hypothetical protein
MWKILKRIALPLLLLLAGSAALVRGWLFHQATVYEETEQEISIAIPNPFPAPPGQPSFLPPEMMFQKVKEKLLVAREEPEWVLVREVTFGGVTRLANGQLKRTYSGKPPALCPT